VEICGIQKRVLGGAGESYLGLFFANLFVTSIAASIAFGMSNAENNVAVCRIAYTCSLEYF